MGLPCLNCKRDVAQDDLKVFAGIFVCPACYQIAERFNQRATEELKSLLVMQRELIRVALVEGRLHLGPAESTKELTKKEVFEELLRLADRKDQKKDGA